MIISHTIL